MILMLLLTLKSEMAVFIPFPSMALSNTLRPMPKTSKILLNSWLNISQANRLNCRKLTM